MFKGLDFFLRFLAMAESEQAPLCSFGLTKTFNFIVILCELFVYSEIIRKFAAENKKITIMTQILVTLNEDATTLHVRKAIELLRGVASVKVFKGNAEKVAEKRRQEAYVKESLTRAFDEVKRARRGEHKMMTDEEFMAELKAEGLA